MRSRAFALLCRSIIALVAVGTVLSQADVADAGTYTVVACGGLAGSTNHLFRGQADGGMAAYVASCPANTNAAAGDMGLVARTVKQNGSVPYLAGAYQIIDAPVGATVAAIHADVNMDRPYSNSPYWSIGIVGFGTDTDRGIRTNEAMRWGCVAPMSFSQCWFAGHVDVAVGYPSARLETRCGNGFGCDLYAYANPVAYTTMWNVAVDISDGTLPSISNVGGGLSGGSWLSGSAAISFDASDNSGIKSAALVIDGAQRTTWTNSSCDYTRVSPCSNLSGGSFSYNVDSLADGSHSLELDVTDTSGNTSRWTRTIYTDHTAPAAPNVTTASGWQSTNGFTATVTNAGGQAAPISTIYYQICDAAGQTCGAPSSASPASGGSGGQTTLPGLSVPSDGDYTVRVYEKDAAGNVSAANLSDSSTAHMRLDRVAPVAPTALAVDGGEDWRSANSFRVSWTNPDGQLAPIAKAYLVVCDASSTCTTTPFSATTITQASGVTVPAVGDYTATVYLEDAAGNGVAANVSNAVHLRFDDTVPGTAQLQYSNGWLDAVAARAYKQPITYPPSRSNIPSGVAGYSVTSDGSDPDASIDVLATGPGDKDDYPAAALLTDLAEGTVTIKARAISGSGVAGATFDAATLRVDKTQPAVSLKSAPDPGVWQRAAVGFVASGADALSGMAAAATGHPVTEGGYLSWRVDDGEWQNVAGDTAQISVTTDGVHTVHYRAYDVAGNPSDEQSVKVRIDVTAPTGSFEAIDAQDPRRLVVDAQDAASGVADGTIQLRPAGGDWRALETTYDGAGHLVAKVIDDAQLPDGLYELRALVTDRAGNRGVVTTRADGSAMQLRFPLRGPVALTASSQIVRATRCRFVRVARLRHGRVVHKRIKVCKATRMPSLRKRGKRIVVRPTVKQTRYLYAQLRDSAGNPIRNAAIAISEQPRTGGAFAERARLATDGAGNVRFTVANSGPSRTIRAEFSGTDQLKPASAGIQVLAPATTSINVAPGRVRTGRKVTFRGRLGGAYIPNGGKTVNVQVFFRGQWRTIATPRSNAKGEWRFAYRFGARYLRPVSYRFRALIMREEAYPFEQGRSRQLQVVVQP